jgi:hypothetical protein
VGEDLKSNLLLWMPLGFARIFSDRVSM